jgi:hypothetical protein
MSKIHRFALSLAGVAFLLALGGSAVQAQGTPPPTVDHYHIYNVDPPHSYGLPVILTDQFGTVQVPVMDLERFGVPVDKNNEGIIDPILHYSWWRINDPEPPRDVLVGNQFGQDQLWQIYDGEFLLNPALKNFDPAGGQQIPTDVNHYKCYRAIGPPVQRQVTLYDQFGVRDAFIAEPQYLCTPTQKVDPAGVVYPIADPIAHLACYVIQPVQFYGIPATFKDQFMQGQIRFRDDCLLCVPSTKNVVTPAEPNSWGRVKALYR